MDINTLWIFHSTQLPGRERQVVPPGAQSALSRGMPFHGCFRHDQRGAQSQSHKAYEPPQDQIQAVLLV